MTQVFLLIAVILLILAIPGPSDDDALYALKASGYSDVTLGGYAWAGCGGEDVLRKRFTAKSPVGLPVSGYVCCGWGKACTVRF